MASKAVRIDHPTSTPSIRKVRSRDLHLRGRVNKSADQIDYHSNKSHFLGFSESKDHIETHLSVRSISKREHRGLEKIKELLSHNKTRLTRSLEKVAAVQKAKTEEASIIYSNHLQKTEITMMNQRISKGFFMKFRPSGLPGKGLPGIASYSRQLLAGKLFKGVI